MLASTSNDIDITNVTLVNDDGHSKRTHIFQYNLNTAKTKKDLYEGALRGDYDREEKNGWLERKK